MHGLIAWVPALRGFAASAGMTIDLNDGVPIRAFGLLLPRPPFAR
jgi:hypothetical protein